jgi:nascent polypeptide-associated complex subunit beta
VQASVQSNTFAVYGHAEEKELTEMLPEVLGQLGQHSTTYLQKMIEQMGGLGAIQNMAAGMGGGKPSTSDAADNDDDVPELVENLYVISLNLVLCNVSHPLTSVYFFTE